MTPEQFKALRSDRRQKLARAYRRLHGGTYEEAHTALRSQGVAHEVIVERDRSRMEAHRAVAKPTQRGAEEGCIVCGSVPIFAVSLQCGPCTFGTAEAIGEGDTW